ncbi:ABC transporter ATP-binding protein [Bacillus sp. V3B]|uniref:ABC transporter ATP-binding protein n=1 Tax=Bacillus sp. V3B TaxID=2804915 RepID=UPI00210DC40B|nr:ABC transporter ATP-binding protein [Bacillus sp. V3B]MCQ6277178.1 ABC transporter ATP-binding protein [Bacillus sp. V3B]
MLNVSNISKSYGSIPILKEISFNIFRGEILGLLGPNGAGKTTTLSILSGLIKPDKGCVSLNNIQEPNEYKSQMGFVSDGLDPYDYLTGREYVTFMGELRGVLSNQIDHFIFDLSHLLSLESKIDTLIKTYSKGMRKKIALMGALVHNPALLILDEPFTGLDPDSIKSIKDYLEIFTQNGNSIIFSTHILEVAEKLCDRLLIIESGKCIASGSIEELRKQNSSLSDNTHSLEEVFHFLTHTNRNN